MGSGCTDSKADGSGWKVSCSKADDAHHLSSGGDRRNLLEGVVEFSTWNCHSSRLHLTPCCSQEQDETGAD